MENHPDTSKDPDATNKMAEINEAYETLSDPQTRTEYNLKQKEKEAFKREQQKKQERARRKYKASFKKKVVIGAILFFIIFGGLGFGHINGEGSYSSNTGIPADPTPAIVTEHTPLISAEHTPAVPTEKPPETYTNSIGMEFVQIPAGEFMMGSIEDGDNISDYEAPVHKVTVEGPYYLSKYEVTQKQWLEVMSKNPSYFQGNTLPVEHISWDDIQEFIKKLNEIEGTDKYRLPSEAEWEYACRAGTSTTYSFGDDESMLYDYAWYIRNSVHKTHPVGQKKPNAWGLYDMHGNVWEWVQESRHIDIGPDSKGNALEDSRSFRAARGGGWSSNTRLCKSGVHYDFYPDYCGHNLGFRLLREI